MSILTQFAKEKGVQIFEDEDWESFHAVANPTGYNGVDVFSGSIDYDMNGVPRLNGGIFSRAITVVGESTTGKTTLAIRLGSSIIDRWNRVYGDLAEMYMKDLEDNTTIRRVQALTGWTDWEVMNRFKLDTNPRTTTDLYNEIRAIADMKEKLRKQLVVKTGFLDLDGSEIEVYSPTVYLVDSIAALSHGVVDFEFDKAGNLKEVEQVASNIDGAREAKANTAFIKKVKGYLSKYNIILIMINHITEEMSTSMYDVPTRFLTFLKPGQKLKGGKELVYQSFAIISLSLKTRITDKDPMYGDTIRGSLTNLTFIKNKSNVEGIPIPMIFDQKTGYRPELSDWEYIYGQGYGFAGSPAAYYLKILPEVKFTKKNLYDSCLSNPLLARAMSFTTRFKMIHDVIKGTVAPDMVEFANRFSYEERVALIISFTDPYPGYENDHIFLPAAIENTALEHQKYIIANDRWFAHQGNYTIDQKYFEDLMLVQEEGEPRFVAGNFAYATPYDPVTHEEEGDYIFPPEED